MSTKSINRAGCLLIIKKQYNRVERRIAAPPSHTTVQAMSHTAV